MEETMGVHWEDVLKWQKKKKLSDRKKIKSHEDKGELLVQNA